MLDGNIEPIQEDKAPLLMSWKKPFITKGISNSGSDGEINAYLASGGKDKKISIHYNMYLGNNKLISKGFNLGEVIREDAVQYGIGSLIRDILGQACNINHINIYLEVPCARLSRIFITEKSTIEVLEDMEKLVVKPNFPPRNGWANGDKARLSMAKANAKADLNILVPLAEVILAKQGTYSKKIDSWTLQIWKKRWSDTKTCRQTKFWFKDGPRLNVTRGST